MVENNIKEVNSQTKKRCEKCGGIYSNKYFVIMLNSLSLECMFKGRKYFACWINMVSLSDINTLLGENKRTWGDNTDSYE